MMRAKLKIGAAMVCLVLWAIARDLHRFPGHNTFTQAILIVVWIGSLALAPWIALRLPRWHRLWGSLFSVGFALALTMTAAGLMLGWPRPWIPISMAFVSGVTAYVFLVDRDVRRLREQLPQTPDLA